MPIFAARRCFALLEVLEAERPAPGSAEEQLLRQGDMGGAHPPTLVLSAEELILTKMELGAGSAGRVVMGHYRGREVAVKLLQLSGPPAMCEAMQREVRLQARVSYACRHTVKLLGVTVKDGQLALVMPKYQGSLTEYMEGLSGGCVPAGSVVLLAIDLLRGLAELHAHGVIMADLKPDNVLLDEGGMPLLCDFGIGRATSMVGQHVLQGSLNYMAPEQFAVDEGDAIMPQSDMWALAATLLHSLTGRPPWSGLNIGQIAKQVGVHRRPPELPPNLHPALSSLLGCCLQPDPGQRPSAAAALAVMERDVALWLQAIYTPAMATVELPAPEPAAAPSPTPPALAAPPLQPVLVQRPGSGVGSGMPLVAPPAAPAQQLQQPTPSVALRAPSSTSFAAVVGRRAVRPAQPQAVPPSGASRSAAGESLGPGSGSGHRQQQAGQVAAARRLLTLHVYLADETLMLIREPAVVMLQLPLVQDVFIDRGHIIEVAARLQLGTLLGAIARAVPIPRPCRRYLLQGSSCAGFRVVTEGELAAGLQLESVMFADAAARTLPSDLASSFQGPFRLMVDNERRDVPALLGSGLVRAGGVCHVGCLEPANMHVIVKTLTGLVFTVPAHEAWQTDELKAANQKSVVSAPAAHARMCPVPFAVQIQDVRGMPPSQQRLIFSGRQLDDNRKLSDYGLVNGSTIDMMLMLRGGKPVICIWPAQPTDVVVRLQLSEHWAFSSLVPRPDCTDGVQGGRSAEWAVRAQPDGTLVHPFSGGREYSYLFCMRHGGDTEPSTALEGVGGMALLYQGSSSPTLPAPPTTSHPGPRIQGLGPTPLDLPLHDFTAAHSFCVAGRHVETWLYEALAAFGVPVRERTDFLTFWLPHMEGAAWLLIAFADPADYQAAAELQVVPVPDVLLRLFMLFERLPMPVVVHGCLAAEVERVGMLRREGAALAVLEWGGMQVVRQGGGLA
ncbi:Mitogen-activated protein kinase kinase 2 [Tetrabaena socialis]|uniref:mitogen-activated protein kinase kinase n=1 Tax=Tetrabaena socialis TaxID=47790 RepID=A0A2J8A723_9CHLO|nr:Mitogen-activated protein kinase kinase 2 [Tetrabaena socialis]|eukprot:PNH08295.1 Mitogen-activated protein kinase kinase 2 [Tetrabaena socialis]